MSALRLAAVAALVSFLGGCSSIAAGPASIEPGWFVAANWGSDDILYCYPPHHKVRKYAGKCFDIN